MEGEGIVEEEEKGRLRWVGSGGSRWWVNGSEVDSEEAQPIWSKLEEDEFRSRFTSGSGSVRRRLFKKPRRVDSFDVEAMEIAGAHGHHNKVYSLLVE